MKLGKTPARKDAIKLKLIDYIGSVQVAPSKYSHTSLQTAPWQMLGNDQYGDCVLAGAGHETMLWNAEASKNVSFSVQDILNAYSAITGFNPLYPETDRGTDMQAAASYRKKTGIGDAQGVRHKVGAYLEVTPNKDLFKQAMYMFGTVGIGFQFPASAMSQFNSGKNWTIVSSSKIEGGHYVPAVGYDSRYVYVVTWGKLIKASWGFIMKYCDESVVYLSQEFLSNGKSLDGFNLTELQADLSQL